MVHSKTHAGTIIDAKFMPIEIYASGTPLAIPGFTPAPCPKTLSPKIRQKTEDF